MEGKRRDDRRPSTWRRMEAERGGKTRPKGKQREAVGEGRRRRDDGRSTF